MAEVDISDVRNGPRFRFHRLRPFDQALEPGEVRKLSEEDVSCLGVPPGEGYVLAFFDTRRVERARSGREGGTFPIPTRTVRIHDLIDASGRAPVGTGPGRRPSPRDPREEGTYGEIAILSSQAEECAPGDQWWLRTDPLEVGDTLSICRYAGDDPWRGLRVRKIHGPIVIALQSQDSVYFSQKWRAQIDTAASYVAQNEVEILNRAFDVPGAYTAPATRQLLVILNHTGIHGPRGLANGRWLLKDEDGDDFVGAAGFVVLNLADGRGHASEIIQILVHELSHVWQDVHRWEYWNGTTPSVGPQLWVLEGGASLMGAEAARRFLGIPLRGNHAWRPHGPRKALAEEVMRANGAIPQGYYHASSFLRDLLIRRIEQTGEAYGAALSHVLAGAMRGWFGNEPNALRGAGLTARMREQIPWWNPVDAVLTWTMSQALDDRVENELYQNRTFLRAWENGGERFGGWAPHAVIGAGAEPSVQEVEVHHGASGFFRIAAANGGTFRIEADSMAWMLGRFR